MDSKVQLEKKSGTVQKKETKPEKSGTKSDGKSGNVQDQMIQLQKTVGNQSVQRMLLQRKGEGSTEVEEETASRINSSRGQGQTLDTGMAARAGSVMGQDFSNVNVHTDSEAAELSNNVNARAFTIGNDIFFNEGEYNPGSSEGQHLIAHELTHVAQQGSAQPMVQGKMTVNDPNDRFEVEADRVADSVMSTNVIQQEGMEEEELQTKQIQREEGMEEEELQAKQIQREEGMEEEEELQMKQIQREEMVEEEELQMKQIQREEMVEEETQS